ncbi:MAG: ferritin family protein [Candidatus Omnitrophota bacterium]
MTAIEALKLALSKEEDAIGIYKELAQKHKVIEDLLMTLVTEEQKHKMIIEKKIVELTRY